LSCWDWIKEQDKENEVPERRYLQIVKEAGKMGVERFHICGGGEPLIRRRTTVGIMTLIKKHGMKGRLITNGTLFTPLIIRKLVEVKWDEIIFSLDAPNAKIHDYLRGVDGTFHKVIKAIKLFEYWKRKFNSKRPRIIIAPLLTNLIYDKLSKMIELAHELGAEEVCIQLMIHKTSGCKDLELSKKQRYKLLKYVHEIKKIANICRINCNIEDFKDTKLIEKSSEKKEVLEGDVVNIKESGIAGAPCFFPWLYMGIFVDGTTQPCADAPIGKGFENIKKKSLSEIWYGEHFNEFRKRLIDRKLFAWCEKCCGNKIFESRTLRNQLLSTLNQR
jgi:MoaA/NifB/PqqE/SkfB family radical SAM enzyme